jgi:hypothetical protein
MTDDREKGFFDRLSEILNQPLPGTRTGTAQGTSSPAPGDQVETQGSDIPDLMDRIREILSTPLPGTASPVGPGGTPAGFDPPHVPPREAAAPAEASTSEGTTVPKVQRQVTAEPAPMAPPAAGLGEQTLDEDWWRRDWEAFRAHQERDHQGFAIKQVRDRERFAAFQTQEQQRFAAYQRQEDALFRHHQQWKLGAWQQYQASIRAGRPLPPPPVRGRPGSPAAGPPGMSMSPPPWMGPSWRRSH